MFETGIRVQDINFINILEYDGISQVNGHSRLFIKGNIGTEFGQSLKVNMNNLPNSILVHHANDIILNGILLDARLSEINEAFTLSLEIGSRSVLMDENKIFRTFQDKNYTYSEVADILSKSNYKFNMFEYSNKTLPSFFVQYHETDWAFFKRVCSNIGLFILTDVKLDIASVGAGFANRTVKKLDKVNIHHCENNHSEYLEKSKRNVRGINQSDFIGYIYKSMEHYSLCDIFQIDGKEYRVHSIKSYLEGAILYRYYYLYQKPAFKPIMISNQDLIGATLQGTVHSVTGHKITVEFDKDMLSQRQYRWFNYATVFSSPDGTGWYFMPEKGDTVRVRFPSALENEAYACSSVHQGVQGYRINPDYKSISTVHDKSIVFSPESIVISNGNGSTVTLHDQEGITMETTEAFKIEAGDDIHVSSNAKITLHADYEVTIEQNDSVINIADDIDLASGHVRIR